ncbi:MAG: hypothetical protein V3R24_08175 [Gemmatimonadales bacterium]
MDTLAVFGLQLVLSLTVFALIAKWFVVPWLAEKPIHLALIVLIFPHAFRHLGLAFLVPGLVSEQLPSSFAFAVAYGDLCLCGSETAAGGTLTIKTVALSGDPFGGLRF